MQGGSLPAAAPGESQMKTPAMIVLRSLAPAALSVALAMGAFGVGCNNPPMDNGGEEGEDAGGSKGSGGKGAGGKGAGGKGVEGSGGKETGSGGSETGSGGKTGAGGKQTGSGGSETGSGGSGEGGSETPKDAGAMDAPVVADAKPMTKTCTSPGLVWKTANKTYYTSYPVPGSEECIKYSGCKYQGMFNVCGDAKNVKSKEWVMAHNIVAMFPLGDYGLHDLCLKSGTKTIVVTVLDTCGDNDCDGCCTQNKGSADALIDIESFTNQRWGVPDGRIQWADLGPTSGMGCFGPP
jgi:hypothetical protein